MYRGQGAQAQHVECIQCYPLATSMAGYTTYPAMAISSASRREAHCPRNLLRQISLLIAFAPFTLALCPLITYITTATPSPKAPALPTPLTRLPKYTPPALDGGLLSHGGPPVLSMMHWPKAPAVLILAPLTALAVPGVVPTGRREELWHLVVNSRASGLNTDLSDAVRGQVHAGAIWQQRLQVTSCRGGQGGGSRGKVDWVQARPKKQR